MVKSNYRTAAEGKHVAAATRRRRRILQAGFFYKCMERNDFQKTKMRFNGERGGWESYRTAME
jgi:hypothetical protein